MKKTISFSSPFIGTRLLLLIFSLGFITINTSNTTPSTDDATHLSRAPIHLDGHLSFDGLDHAARDFGNRCSLFPLAVLHPKSVSDISRVVKYVYEKGLESSLTVAARGNGHSLEGQAQAHKGVVIDMVSLEGEGMIFGYDRVEVSGGELWINVLHESIKRGMTPRSWTDYLHLTVGGTLSNAGISGQAFRHGPQIDNVYQLQVVTGKGEVLDCSEGHNSDIFHGVLGGLGQFGIITKATIALQPAPTKVKWIRALYSDFSIFTEDQEHLISSEKTFDYIEGFAIKNKTGLLNNWKSSSFSPKDPVQLANPLVSQGNIFFCLEVAKYFNPQESHHIDQDIDEMLSGLKYIESTVFVSEVSYVDFLDRVHISEMKLREKGLWEVPHPWLNLLVPRSSIHEFAKEVFGNIIMDTNNGPVLIYPVNKSRWKTNKKSFVTPDEDIFYLVAFLSSAIPSGKDGLESILIRNNKILDFCKRARLRVKQYLPHYSTTEDWKNHFGAEWGVFSTRKLSYDPLAILAPGQRIFQRSKGFALQ